VSYGVSVVIPTYNRADLVLEAARSALAQDWSPLEVIVVDDCSVDDTAARIAALSQHDSRVRLVRLEQNRGESAARNRGVSEATHEYLAFLDSDDRFAPGKLAAQMPPLLESRDKAVAFTGYISTDGSVETTFTMDDWASDRGFVLEALLVGSCVHTSTFVAPREVMLRAGPFRSDLRYCEDHDLWLRLAMDGTRFIYNPAPLTVCSRHDTNLTSHKAEIARCEELVISEFLERADLPDSIRARRREHLARWALNAAILYAAAGEGRKALGALARGARLRPLAVRPGWGVLALRAARSAFRQPA